MNPANSAPIPYQIGIVANTTTGTICPWASYKLNDKMSEVGQEYI